MYAAEIVTGPAAALSLVLKGGTEYIYVHNRGTTPRKSTVRDPVISTVPNKRRKDTWYSANNTFLAKSLAMAPDASGECGLPVISLSISK